MVGRTGFGNVKQEGCQFIIQSLLQKDAKTVGWLVCAVPDEADPADYAELMKFLGWLCEQELVQQTRLRAVESRYQKLFLYDLLYNNFDSGQDIIQQGKIFGYDFTQSYYVCVLEADDDLSINRREGLNELIASVIIKYMQLAYCRAIVTVLHSQVIILLQADNKRPLSKQALSKLLDGLRQNIYARLNGELTVSIGIGKLYSALTELCKSYQEAKQAVALGRFIREADNITLFEELGLLKILSHVSIEELNDYYQDILGPLVEYDRANETEYLKTLQMYYQQNEDINSTADKLYIHVNTLRNRLKKLEEILDTDLRRTAERVKLYAACQSGRILMQNNIDC